MIELHPKMSGKRLENHIKGQEKMTAMLREFDMICRKYNIQYWCHGGTFIGAVRHSGWIPYDGDVDIGMLKEDYNIFKTKINELPKHMWFQTRDIDTLYKESLPKIRDINSSYIQTDRYKWHCGLQLDMFLYEKKDDKIVKIFKRNDKEYNIIFNYDMIFPLKELLFEGISVYVPNQIEEYSKLVWGSYPIPLLPVEKRYPHEGDIDPSNPRKQDIENYQYLYNSP